MTDIIEIKTERLLLRQWRLSDFDLFAQLNSNDTVMEFYPKTLSQNESDELAQKIQKKIADNGWGFWAIEIPGVSEFIGFVGLNKPSYELPFSPGVEIGWRLSNKYWGNGYATEAGQSALAIGFKQLNLSEIVAFASVQNYSSINVMKRLKMTNTN